MVFACQHFESYIYGKEIIHIETDHQPLVSIVLKPLNRAPSQLQWMLFKLQRLNLRVTYKKGKSMYLADTLSWAYLLKVHTCFHQRTNRNWSHNRIGYHKRSFAADQTGTYPQMTQSSKPCMRRFCEDGQKVSLIYHTVCTHILIFGMNWQLGTS